MARHFKCLYNLITWIDFIVHNFKGHDFENFGLKICIFWRRRITLVDSIVKTPVLLSGWVHWTAFVCPWRVEGGQGISEEGLVILMHVRLWDQFNYKNIHDFDFWLNLAILKPRIYSKSQNTQSLGYEFVKKSWLRRWCKFLSKNHKSHGFVTCGWWYLDAAYLNYVNIYDAAFLFWEKAICESCSEERASQSWRNFLLYPNSASVLKLS